MLLIERAYSGLSVAELRISARSSSRRRFPAGVRYDMAKWYVVNKFWCVWVGKNVESMSKLVGNVQIVSIAMLVHWLDEGKFCCVQVTNLKITT
jgi:hypothetical protein